MPLRVPVSLKRILFLAKQRQREWLLFVLLACGVMYLVQDEMALTARHAVTYPAPRAAVAQRLVDRPAPFVASVSTHAKATHVVRDALVNETAAAAAPAASPAPAEAPVEPEVGPVAGSPPPPEPPEPAAPQQGPEPPPPAPPPPEPAGPDEPAAGPPPARVAAGSNATAPLAIPGVDFGPCSYDAMTEMLNGDLEEAIADRRPCGSVQVETRPSPLPEASDAMCSRQEYAYFSEGRARATPLRIVDAFVFNFEVDLLEVRLRELDDVVDMFVVVEPTHTETGEPKTMFWRQRAVQERIRNFKHKVTYARASPSEMAADDSTAIHNSSRRKLWNTVLEALETVDANDVLLYGQIDEIPPAEMLHAYKVCATRRYDYVFETKHFMYSFHYLAPEREHIARRTQGYRAYGPMLARVKDVSRQGFEDAWSDEVLLEQEAYIRDIYVTPPRMETVLRGGCKLSLPGDPVALAYELLRYRNVPPGEEDLAFALGELVANATEANVRAFQEDLMAGLLQLDPATYWSLFRLKDPTTGDVFVPWFVRENPRRFQFYIDL